MNDKQKKQEELAADILSLVGGEENIEKMIHCVTRLRFYLKDRSKADRERLEDVTGVLGVAEANNQFQVIVGQAVDDIYKALEAQLSSQYIDSSESTEAETQSGYSEQSTLFKKVTYRLNQLIGVVTGSVMPIISILAASGIIKSILAVGTGTGLITNTGNAFLIIDAMADAVFYFLPILIGFNAAKRLGGNPVLTAVIGGVIMYPSILEAADNELMILALGNLNFPYVSYTYSIFPMILAAWLVKVGENWLKKWVPSYIQAIFIPILIIGFVSTVTFLLTGPVITWISFAMADGLQALLSWNAALFGGLIAGLYQILVIFGLHWGIIPIYVNDFAIQGYSYLSAIISFSIVGQGGAALAVAVKSKKAPLKEIGYASAISAFCGITEPAIYGVNLRFKRPFICACIGSAVGGFFAGLLRINMWSIIGSIIGLPSFIDPDNGVTANFWYAVIVTLGTLAIAFLLTYFWGYNDQMTMHKKKEKSKNPGKQIPASH